MVVWFLRVVGGRKFFNSFLCPFVRLAKFISNVVNRVNHKVTKVLRCLLECPSQFPQSIAHISHRISNRFCRIQGDLPLDAYLLAEAPQVHLEFAVVVHPNIYTPGSCMYSVSSDTHSNATH